MFITDASALQGRQRSQHYHRPMLSHRKVSNLPLASYLACELSADRPFRVKVSGSEAPGGADAPVQEAASGIAQRVEAQGRLRFLGHLARGREHAEADCISGGPHHGFFLARQR